MEMNEILAKTTDIVDAALRIKETLNSSSLGEVKLFDATSEVSCSDAQRDLFESLLSSNNETKLAKVFAASSKIAQSLGVIKLNNDSIEYVASISDEVSTRLRTAHQVATGQIDLEEAGDKIIDRASARLIVLADNYIDKQLPIVVDTMCAALTAYYPPAAPVADLIKKYVPVLQPKIKQVINSGINAIAVKAKQSLPKVINWAKEKSMAFAKKAFSIA